MDKYFNPTYDPRFDVSLPDLTLPNGLIGEGAFDGWNRMLEVVKERKEVRKEREKREKEGRREERERRRKERRRRRGEEASGSESEEERGNGNGAAGLLSAGFDYAKKGAEREWDRGKMGG